MKKLLLTMFLIIGIGTQTKAQTIPQQFDYRACLDTLIKKVDNIELHLQKSHKEFKVVTVLFITGALLSL